MIGVLVERCAALEYYEAREETCLSCLAVRTRRSASEGDGQYIYSLPSIKDVSHEVMNNTSLRYFLLET